MHARVIFCLLALWTLAFPGLAADRRIGPSLDRVLPEIRRTTPGTFYDAEGPFLAPDGAPTYRIKWMMPDGRIVWFYADGRTGRIVGQGAGWMHGGYPPPSRFRDDDWPQRGWHGGDRDWRGGGGDWHGGRDGDGGHGGGQGGHDGGGRRRHGG